LVGPSYTSLVLVLVAYVTLLYGDGGVAKSLLALALALAVARDSEEWLGREVEGCPVLHVDFELDAEEQARRVHQLCRGQGVDSPPENLLYMSTLGHPAREAFTAALEACIEHSIGLLVVDSLGPALQGDAEAARDVIGFFQKSIEPFRAEGVAVLIIDHQSRLQAGQSYQSKGAFGSVFKTNLARSVIQAQATERGEGTLTVRLRQKKHNFGPLAEPFGVKLTFTEEVVDLEAVELDASELAEEATLNATDRVKLALEDGPAYPWEIAERTGLAIKTVKNALTGLRKQEVVERTGEVESRTEQVRLSVPASLSLYRDGDGDDSDIYSQREVFELAHEYSRNGANRGAG
jgi:DNA-binding CsgD family transcriptional regulator